MTHYNQSLSDHPLHLCVFMFGWHEQCVLTVLACFGQHYHDAQDLMMMVWQVVKQQAFNSWPAQEQNQHGYHGNT